LVGPLGVGSKPSQPLSGRRLACHGGVAHQAQARPERLGGPAAERPGSRTGRQRGYPLGRGGWSAKHGRTAFGTPARSPRRGRGRPEPSVPGRRACPCCTGAHNPFRLTCVAAARSCPEGKRPGRRRFPRSSKVVPVGTSCPSSSPQLGVSWWKRAGQSGFAYRGPRRDGDREEIADQRL
jgi:hypothetical protein